MNKLMFVSVLALGAATAAFGETYYFAPGTTIRGNFSSVDCWLSAGGQKPAYAPTSLSCDPNDTYIVKDGKQTRDDGAGPATMNIYGRVIYGEIGGTAGNHYEESQYSRSGNAKLNFCHADGATLRKGAYTAGNGTTDSTYGNRVMGKITVESPASDPYVFKGSNATDGRYVYFENSFAAQKGAGLKFAETGVMHWQFRGDLSGYQGSMDFTKSGSDILLAGSASEYTGYGSLNMDGLTLADSMTVTVASGSAPLRFQTLTLGTGVCWKLAGGLAEEDGALVGKVTTLDTQTLVQNGTVRIEMPVLSTTASKSATVRVPLVKSATGGVVKENFDVVIPVGDQEYFQGIAVDVDGAVQTLVAVYSFQKIYLLTQHLNSRSGQLITDPQYWRTAAGETGTVISPDDTYVASGYNIQAYDTVSFDGGRLIFRDNATFFIYASFGMTSGVLELADAGTLADKTSGVVFPFPVNVTGNAKVLHGDSGDRDVKRFTFNGALGGSGVLNVSTVGLVINGDMSAFKGTIAKTYPFYSVTIGANTGTLDFEELSMAAQTTVVVQNVTSPMILKTLTLGDGAALQLSAAVTRDGSGFAVSSARVDAQTVGLPQTDRPALVLPRLSIPQTATAEVAIDLVTSRTGGLAKDSFDVWIDPTDRQFFAGTRVVDNGTEGQTFQAVFSVVRDETFGLTAEGSGARQASHTETKYWADIDGNTLSVPPSDPSCDADLSVKDGRSLVFYCTTASVVSPFNSHSLAIGEVGGTSGTLDIYNQWSAAAITFNGPLTLANGKTILRAGAHTDARDTRSEIHGTATVTAPVDEPFVVQFLNENAWHWLYLSLSSDPEAGLKGDGAASAWLRFYGSLAEYRGSMDFSVAPQKLTFGTQVGAVDMAALRLSEAADVTLECTDAPFKTGVLTAGSNTVFNLKAVTTGTGSSAVVAASGFEAETVGIEGPLTINLSGSVGRVGTGAKLTLLKAAKGTLPPLSDITFNNLTTGKALLEHVEIVSDGDGEALVATFEGARGMALILR